MPGIGSRRRCRGERTDYQLDSIERADDSYRAEVDDAALGTPAAEVLDIEADVEVMFRATR